MLSDLEILRRLTAPDVADRLIVTPLLDSRQIQAASIDLRLGFHFKTVRNIHLSALDPMRDEPTLAIDTERYTHDVRLDFGQPFYIHPGQFALATTFEYLRLPRTISASLEGRSSLGRLGVTVHSTAGFIDPGFSGRITYEMKNEGTQPVALYPGTRVAQLCFFELSSHVLQQYGPKRQSKYSQQLTTTSSRWYEDRDIRFLRTKLRPASGQTTAGAAAETTEKATVDDDAGTGEKADPDPASAKD